MPTTHLFTCQRLALTAFTLAALCASAQAQVYRTQGANGQTVFTDRPSGNAKIVPTQPTSTATQAQALPYDVQQAMKRYPLTLYTTKACAACDEAKKWLIQRGLPFSERQVNTPEDQQALLPNSTGTTSISMPQFRVGNQALTGFNSQTWGRYIAAAGYPDQIQLPASYRRPEPTPLASSAAAPVSKANSSGLPDANSVPPAKPPPRNPSNPTGIRF